MGLFKQAKRSQRKLRAAIDGPTGAGKTFTALRLAFSLVKAGLGNRVAVIDTENASASLYEGEAPDGFPWQFAAVNLNQFGPDQYTFMLREAIKEKFDIIVIDSLSHAWIGKGGALDLVDQKGGNKFAAWKDVTPMHREMVDAIIQSPAHVIATMRSKMEYVLEEQTNKDGKSVQVPVKKGMNPLQREGMEYEFDLFASVDLAHQIKVTKSRCSPMDNATAVKPGPQFWQPLFDWMSSAAPVPTPELPPAATSSASPPAHEPAPTAPAAAPANTAPAPVSGATLVKQFADKVVECETVEAVEKLRAEVRTVIAEGRLKQAEVLTLKPIFDTRATFLQKRDDHTKSSA